MPAKDELFNGFSIGDWEVLPNQGVLRRGEEEVRPEPKVFEVLLVLASRDGNLVTRDDLVAEVWGGRATSDEPINRCLSQLRGHLGDRRRPHRYIETLQRRGYRLMQPVVLHPPAHPRPAADSGSRRPRAGILVGLAVAVIAAGAGLSLLLLPTDGGGLPGSVAVLPIDNLSGDPDNQYIVDGIKNALVNRLSEVADLPVMNARRSYDLEPAEIARLLDVDTILTGAVQLEENTLKVTYLITRGKDGVTIGSGEVNGDLEAVFSLQQRLATAVSSELVGDPTPELITQYTPDSQAYNSYLRGLYAFEHRGDGDNLEKAIELFQESIELDEYYGPAYLSLATAYALLPRYRNTPVSEASRMAIETAKTGVSFDANIGDAASAVFGSFYHQQKKWSESEAAYQRAVTAQVVDSNAFNWYSRMLASVGRLDDALQQALAAVTIDPDNAVINTRVATVYTWLGESEKAHEYFERAAALGASGATFSQPYALLLKRDGELLRAKSVLSEGAPMDGTTAGWVDSLFDAFADPLRAGEALKALDGAAMDGGVPPQVEVVARTLLGDVDGAMAVAQGLRGIGEVFEMDLLFAPELQPLREHPAFAALLEELGVVAYWRQAGCDWNGRVARCSRP